MILVEQKLANQLKELKVLMEAQIDETKVQSSIQDQQVDLQE